MNRNKRDKLGPGPCEWAERLAKRTHCPMDEAHMQKSKQEPEKITTTAKDIFRIKGEPLYEGKGKNSNLTYSKRDTNKIVNSHVGAQHTAVEKLNQDTIPECTQNKEYSGLNKPKLRDHERAVVGGNKPQMRRENKHRRQELRAEQQITSPWTKYEGQMESTPPTNHAECPPHRNSIHRVRPGNIQRHNYQRSGHHSDAQQKQESHGRERRSRRPLLEDLTGRPSHPRHYNTLH